MLAALFSKDRSILRDLLVLAGVVLFTYGPSLAGVFGGDDLILIQNVRDASWSFSDLARSFEWDERDVTDGWLPPTFQEFRLQYFRPAVVASIKLDQWLWDDWAPGYFLSNILLYLLITFLVYAWGADFGLERRQQLLLALLFATYSVNQVAVSRINGRTELVAAVFLLISVISLGRFHANRRPLYFATAMAAAVLALGSKENCVMLPFFHVSAALFLYAPGKERPRRAWARRAWAIAPFFVLAPLYLLVRTAALDGFPIPPRGFYFHHPADPGFVLFVFAKLVHAPLALVFQLPAQLFPVFLERSMPSLIAAGVLSALTVVFVIRKIRPPLRYFFLSWTAIALAPTLPMGYNSIYFFLCSPLVALLYVKGYQHYARSSIRWQARFARIALPATIVLGILASMGGTLAVRGEGMPARNAARAIIPLLDTHPDAQQVYFIDVPPACIYALMPAIRFQAPRHANKSFATLSVTADLGGTVPSEVVQQDAYTFDVRPDRSAYLRTGLEEILLQKSLPTFAPGMKAEVADYSIEVLDVEQEYVRDEGALITALRDHFGAPPAHQRGITRLRFHFEEALSADGVLFVQLRDGGARALVFQ